MFISRSFIWSFFKNFEERNMLFKLRNFHKFIWTQHSVCCIFLVISFMVFFQGGNFNIPIYLSFYVHGNFFLDVFLSRGKLQYSVLFIFYVLWPFAWLTVDMDYFTVVTLQCECFTFIIKLINVIHVLFKLVSNCLSIYVLYK